MNVSDAGSSGLSWIKSHKKEFVVVIIKTLIVLNNVNMSEVHNKKLS